VPLKGKGERICVWNEKVFCRCLQSGVEKGSMGMRLFMAFGMVARFALEGYLFM
jgi:hypothetical protein